MMILLGCVALVCFSALAGLRMWLDQKPRISRDEYAEFKDFITKEVAAVEKHLVTLGQKTATIEKVAKMQAGPQPMMSRADPSLGPLTRAERREQKPAEG